MKKLASDLLSASQSDCLFSGSADCQKSDWNSGHKLKCKVFRSTDSSPVGRDDLDFKGSLFGNSSAYKKTKVALVPQLSQIKATVKPTDVLFPYETFVKCFNWDKPIMAPCGLTNCGNSCFANVVLQCLSWTRPLVAYLLERGHKRECRRNDWCFFCEFETHLDRAAYFRQAKNGLFIRMALLKLLLVGW